MFGEVRKKIIIIPAGDAFGQLGLGNTQDSATYASPKSCSFSIVVEDADCGDNHAAIITSTQARVCLIALLEDGNVYMMGSNEDGKLGIGSLREERQNVPTLINLLIGHHVSSISCGWAHTVCATCK